MLPRRPTIHNQNRAPARPAYRGDPELGLPTPIAAQQQVVEDTHIDNVVAHQFAGERVATLVSALHSVSEPKIESKIKVVENLPHVLDWVSRSNSPILRSLTPRNAFTMTEAAFNGVPRRDETKHIVARELVGWVFPYMLGGRPPDVKVEPGFPRESDMIVAFNPETGEIESWYGGVDEFGSGPAPLELPIARAQGDPFVGIHPGIEDYTEPPEKKAQRQIDEERKLQRHVIFTGDIVSGTNQSGQHGNHAIEGLTQIGDPRRAGHQLARLWRVGNAVYAAGERLKANPGDPHEENPIHAILPAGMPFVDLHPENPYPPARRPLAERPVHPYAAPEIEQVLILPPSSHTRFR